MILTDKSSLGYIPRKIISLVPSQTELLFDLGLQEEVIAITKFCVHPTDWFQTKTRIGGTKALNIEKIIELQPDLIIANNEENVKDQVASLAQHFPVWVTEVANLEDAVRMIDDIGTLTGKQAAADMINAGILSAFEHFEKRVNETPVKINAAYFIWRDPYMTIGRDTFIHDMMQRAGLHNIFENETRYPEISIEDLKDRHCELILLSSEPFPFAEKHIPELQDQLPGVKMILVDGEMFSWYGSRLLKTPAYMDYIRQQVMHN